MHTNCVWSKPQNTHPIWLQSAEQSFLSDLWNVQWGHCSAYEGDEAMRHTTARLSQHQHNPSILKGKSALSSRFSNPLSRLLLVPSRLLLAHLGGSY